MILVPSGDQAGVLSAAGAIDQVCPPSTSTRNKPLPTDAIWVPSGDHARYARNPESKAESVA
jgi:hypothetical protein